MKVKTFVAACALMFGIGFGMSAMAARAGEETSLTPDQQACILGCEVNGGTKLACTRCCLLHICAN